MDKSPERAFVAPRPWRLALWLAFVISWTAALLMPAPEQVAKALLVPFFMSRDEFKGMGQPLMVFSKSVHVAAYALFAILSGWLHVPWRSRWLLLVFLSLHGFGTEFFQNFVVSRHPSLRDVGLDHLGLALGLALSWKWWLQKP
jgi:hypothetical protein